MRRLLECSWLCLWCVGAVAGLSACRTTTTELPSEVGSRELLERADRSFGIRSYDDALETYKLAAYAARKEGDSTTFVEAAAQTATVLAIFDQHIEGREWLRQAAAEADEEDTAAWSRYLLVRGVYEGDAGEQTAAEATYRELYGYALTRGRPDRALQATHMATLVTSGDVQIAWVRKGIEIAREAGELAWEAEQWTNLGWLLEDRGQFADALLAFRRGYELGAQLGGERGRLKADWVLAHALRVAGHSAAARQLLNKTASTARGRYRHLGGAPNDAEWIARCEAELAELDAAAGDRRNALRRLNTASRYFLEAGAEIRAPDTYKQVQARMRELRAAELRAD